MTDTDSGFHFYFWILLIFRWTLCKADISIKWTLLSCTNGVHFIENLERTYFLNIPLKIISKWCISRFTANRKHPISFFLLALLLLSFFFTLFLEFLLLLFLFFVAVVVVVFVLFCFCSFLLLPLFLVCLCCFYCCCFSCSYSWVLLCFLFYFFYSFVFCFGWYFATLLFFSK